MTTRTIELIADHAVAIDRAARKLKLASGASLDYGHLVLATGARNRLLDIPNANLPNVRYLRILDDSEDLRRGIAASKRVVVIGAGFIGLEFAATARIKGLEVDVLELASRVMARAVTAEVSDYFQKRHAEAGIRIHLGVMATAIEADGDNDHRRQPQRRPAHPADLVVVGVGVLPNVELAAEAGLPTPPASSSTTSLLTADPDISAIGDCALFESPRFGGSLRLESVQNATDHARCVAARLTGDDKSYDGQPWFWSDQGDDKLQIAGLTTGYDQVVLRGDPAQRAFSAFCYRRASWSASSWSIAPAITCSGGASSAWTGSSPRSKAADPTFDLKAALA